jgi:putative membrane protein, TIGR04086 family
VIIIKKLLVYGKYIGLFILIELFISFILGLFNLIGVSSYITSLISFVINISLFFTLSFIKGKHTNKKGIICGLINGLILILTLFIITLILFIRHLSYTTLLYYLILLSSSVIGGILGKNTQTKTRT